VELCRKHGISDATFYTWCTKYGGMEVSDARKLKALEVRRRGGRKRALGMCAPITLPQRANQRWSLDFVSDALADGRRFGLLVIVDDFTRECSALVVDTSISGRGVMCELDAIIAARRKPLMIISDNGTELTSHAILRWQEERGADGTTSRPESRSRTPLSKASMGASGRSASTNTSSGACRWRAGSLRLPTSYQPTSLGELTPNEFAARSQQDHNQNGFLVMSGAFRGQRQCVSASRRDARAFLEIRQLHERHFAARSSCHQLARRSSSLVSARNAKFARASISVSRSVTEILAAGARSNSSNGSRKRSRIKSLQAPPNRRATLSYEDRWFCLDTLADICGRGFFA
jgi:hypothetical protein